ncbi:MAG: hypothetical protein FJ271_15240 [Planctomycetes bacterium]|nr:hypothetical protein [Planctomycetota bacterium]
MCKRTVLCIALAALVPGCGWDGHFAFLGYSTQPNYDRSIRTVYVPMFGNQTFYREWEMELTRAVIREIESKTPYKVVSNPERADTELIGKIVNINKSLINANQLNEVRESQVIMNVEIIWRDLRPGQQGQVLSAERQGGARAPVNPLEPLAPSPPTLVTAMGNFVPELGGSITSAQQLCCDRAAIQIISMMEIWPEPAAVAAVPAVPIAP